MTEASGERTSSEPSRGRGGSKEEAPYDEVRRTESDTAKLTCSGRKSCLPDRHRYFLRWAREREEEGHPLSSRLPGSIGWLNGLCTRLLVLDKVPRLSRAETPHRRSREPAQSPRRWRSRNSGLGSRRVPRRSHLVAWSLCLYEFERRSVVRRRKRSERSRLHRRDERTASTRDRL